MALDLENVSLVLLSAGDSVRFSQSLSCKKQWLRIGETPLWQLVAQRFTQHFGFKHIIITASPSDFAYMREISPYEVVRGGATRAQSLQNALGHIDTPFVLVSDVARWNVQESVVLDMLRYMGIRLDSKNLDSESSESSSQSYPHATPSRPACVVPFISISDTSFYAKQSEASAHDSGDYLKREAIRLIQTPQLSDTALLKAALQAYPESTDESSALHAMGHKVAFVQGSHLMNKLTFAHDLASPACEALRNVQPSQRVFVGQGVDVHEFEEGKPMWLGGVEIDSPFGFKAHSDGDVALHALSDAILGAIGGGDIGQWFPDSDARFAGADSKELLRQIYDFAKSVGFTLHNADLTIMAQTPRLLEYKPKMRSTIAQILELPLWRVNIKATTTEGLGFIGRKEGVCVLASVSMGLFDWQSALLEEKPQNKGGHQ